MVTFWFLGFRFDLAYGYDFWISQVNNFSYNAEGNSD